MTRSLAISARQITAICKGVAKAGFVAEVVINGIVVRLVPEGRAKSAASLSEDEPIDHLFSASHTRATAQPPYVDTVSDYYKKIGYDPRTMNEDDFTRLVAEADARWNAETPTLPLDERERTLRKT
ncbi:hypothetical protein [Mesorhizobium amorphae]|uniref:hypothetical protein n=1 Tax=Mesorhizobium amorphae TaxID=71433 RepID=UPI00177C6166|nr:hypothetical protein [Mesorhizobium amorphae]